MILATIFLIYIIGCIYANFNISHHNSLCDISEQFKDDKMSYWSTFASWFYFLVEHHTFGVGEIPDDIANQHAPDDDTHFDHHLYID